MKKLLLFLAIPFGLILGGCRAMQLMVEEKIENKGGFERIQLENNQLIITADIEGKPQRLLVDFGANISSFFDTSMLPGYYRRKKAVLGKASGAGHGKVVITGFPAGISNGLYFSGNKVFAYFENKALLNKSACSGSQVSGLYGNDFFKKSESVVYLDFDQEVILNLNPGQYDTLLTMGFQQIQTSFHPKGITLFLTIDGKQYPFLFDTGFSGSFNIPGKQVLPALQGPHLSYEGLLGIVVTGVTAGREAIYENKQVRIGDAAYSSTIMVSDALKVQNMGMGFIKAFNWIIDYRNARVFLKKNGLSQDTALTQHPTYLPAILEGKLLVIKRAVNATGYQPGDEIIRVKGQPVTEENKCELLRLLRENSDWKKLEVVVKSVAR